MCEKINWSVVATLVNILALVFYTAAVASFHWAVRTDDGYVTHAGLFMACPTINETCYDTYYHFQANPYEKGVIIASAVLNVFALMGFYFFTALSVFFLCGLYREKRLATGAIITAYVAAFLAIIGIGMYAVAIKRLGYALSWSFALAVVGMIISITAGILMCVGRNISMMSNDADDDDKPTGRTGRRPIGDTDFDATHRKQGDTSFDATHRKQGDTGFDVTNRKQMRMEEELEYGGELPRKKPLPGAYN